MGIGRRLRGRRTLPCPRNRRPARSRCIHHAGDRQWQHQRTHHHDCRESERPDSRQTTLAPVRRHGLDSPAMASRPTLEARMSLPNFERERIDLAAAFRWFARLGMAESVANHFSVAVSKDGSQFLVNPCRRHFSQIKASELLLLNANDPSTLSQPDAPDPTAWYLHAGIHAQVPHARCIMHLHCRYATALGLPRRQYAVSRSTSMLRDFSAGSPSTLSSRGWRCRVMRQGGRRACCLTAKVCC